MSVHSYNHIAKETEKAWLVDMNGAQFWIPKSACHINKDEGKILIQDWFEKNMDDKGIIFSDDKRYQYVLWRTWDKTRPKAMCIGLHAKGSLESPTIERLTKTLQAHQYGGLVMCNLFTVVSSAPTPKEVLNPETCGDIKEAMGLIFSYSLNVKDVIFCWGSFAEAKERAQKVIDWFDKALCFGKNQDGSPWHPMSLHYAGLDAKKTQLFNFREHTYEKNKYDRKERKKKVEYNEKQFKLIPNENLL